MSLVPGTYRAKIVKFGIGETQAKDPQAVVEFNVLDLGELTPEQFDAGEYESGRNFDSEERITWFGSFAPLSPGKQISAKEITLEALSKMGFNGDFGEFADGFESGALKTDRIYALFVVDNNYDQKHPGAVKVSSVNLPGESGPGARVLSKAEALKKIAGKGLEGDFKKMQAKNGAGPANAAPAAAAKEEKKAGKPPRF